MERFRVFTYDAMNEMPEKKLELRNSVFLDEKADACRQDRSRHQLLRKQPFLSSSSIQAGHDKPDEFLENTEIEKNITNLDKSFRFGETKVMPWSGDYWALRTGGIGKRYNDPAFPSVSSEWQDIFDYFLKLPTAKIAKEFYSPAEKYDALVGDHKYTLTHANWKNGQQYNERLGKVEPWMGLCHGWAPASFMEPRPATSVSLTALNSTENIYFLPDDIKALLTLKWANGINVSKDFKKSGTRFLGGRCDVKNPERDPESGRIIDPACFDLNPGSWHLVITNHIVSTHRPLIIDASFDYEVWNQPVKSFRYRYFNPETLKESEVLSESIVKLNAPAFKDKFRKFRDSAKSESVVGVIMEVTYISENSPSARDYDNQDFDRANTVTYYYDLELDKNENIIGGEWYQNRHPDFVWMPIKDSVVINQEDLVVKTDSDAVQWAPVTSEQNIPLIFVLNKLKPITE